MLFLILFLIEPDFVQDTGIFHNLGPKYAAVTPDEHVFTLDRFEQNLWLHQRGMPARQIARRGLGPGELDRANRIFWYQDRLYVECAVKFQIFDHRGIHIQELRRPPGTRHLHRMVNGWIAFHWGLNSHTSKLMFFSEDFSQKKTIKEWSEPKRGGVEKGPGGLRKVNPIPDISIFTAQAGSSLFYYRMPEEDIVRVYDVVKQTQKESFELNAKRYPFNPEWGDRKIEEFRDQLKGKTVEGDFPEFFPVASALFMDIHGNLIYRKETGKPSAEFYRIRPDGLSVPFDYQLDGFNRITAFQNGAYYVSYHTNTDEYALAKVPKDKLASFLEQNPSEN